MEVVASLSEGRTAAAQCGLFTHKSVPVIFEPPCNIIQKRMQRIYSAFKIPLKAAAYIMVFKAFYLDFLRNSQRS